MAGLTDQDVAALRTLVQDWCAAGVAQDWDKTLSLCADDLVYMPPDHPTLRGHSEFRAWLEQFPPIEEMHQELEHAEGEGDLAVIRVTTAVKTEMEGRKVSFTGKVLCSLTRNSAGAWKVDNVCLSWDQPMSEVL